MALGDLEADAQGRLEQRLRSGVLGVVLPVDVVKVAHHGSAKQDPGLYRLLGAQVALIGVGAGNDYGHPAPSTLAVLAGLGEQVWRTDRDGMVVVR